MDCAKVAWREQSLGSIRAKPQRQCDDCNRAETGSFGKKPKAAANVLEEFALALSLVISCNCVMFDVRETPLVSCRYWRRPLRKASTGHKGLSRQ